MKDTLVSILTQGIYTMNKNMIGPAVDLIGLELWKVLKPVIVENDDDEGTNELAQFLADFRLDPKKVAKQMRPASKLGKYFTETPAEESIHVIVVVPGRFYITV